MTENLSQEQLSLIKQQHLETHIKAAKASLKYFAQNVMGFTNSPHHDYWYDLLQDKKNRKSVILAPRNHAKSTCFSIVYPAWYIGNNPNARIIIVSSTSSQSEAFLRSIKAILNDSRYQDVFGKLKPTYPERWSSREIIINRDTREKDPTISTVGAGGAILSKRADIIICDDILNKDNTRTPDQRQKVEEWFQDVLMPVLEPAIGRVFWISTAFNTEDLSHQLLQDPTYDVKIKTQAILQEADRQDLWGRYRDLMFSRGKGEAEKLYKQHEEEMNKGAEVLWSERWSYKNLFDERLSLGTRSFNLMYQNDAVSDETAVIKEAWIEKCKDKNRRLIDSFTQAEYPQSIMVITQGVDLAISENEMANETVITTLGKTADNRMVILNAIGGHWSPSDIRSTIKGQNDRFNPSLILVESNAFQASMVKDLQSQSVSPIKGFQTTGEKFDPFVGINSMAVLLENGQFIIPADPSHSRTVDYYERIKYEMISFPSGHTGDWLMSLWFAFTAMRNMTSNQVFSVSGKGIKSSLF
jgi:hypothetical protein